MRDDAQLQQSYSQPTLACDIVMKGGITSGVVYPQTVCTLARTYKLRNVGGTSAGAIAAAVAGAAELGRNSTDGGFHELARLPKWIGSGTNLFGLFQPQPKTRRLYQILTAGLGMGRGAKLRVALFALATFPLSALASASPGILLIVVAVLQSNLLMQIVGVVCGALLTLLCVWIGPAIRIAYQLGHNVPKNGFGLCSGMSTDWRAPALTPWLTDMLNRLADKKEPAPLTFGDLAAADVNLQFMTTNLTLRRPYRMPWTTREYFFHPEEFKRLFPEEVVRWMIDNPPEPTGSAADQREWLLLCELLRPLRPFPGPDKLPVIVATRMSLSFPILLSALPLWSIDMSRGDNQEVRERWNEWVNQHADDWRHGLETAKGELPAPVQAERCWFSDGGISSNFPVHFFDTPLPTRPTFAINLRPFLPDVVESTNEEENVYLPATSGGGILEWWYRFPQKPGLKQLGAFLAAIVRTMQNRVDEAQMRVPGYRDRIAHVSLSPSEGGMNLNMPPEVIERLTHRGGFAAEKLVRRFAHPPEKPGDLSWDSHRWTRYRSTLASLSDLLQTFGAAYQASPATGERTYRQLSERGRDEAPSAYRWATTTQQAIGNAFSDALVQAATVDPDGQLHRRAPRPEPETRTVPRV